MNKRLPNLKQYHVAKQQQQRQWDSGNDKEYDYQDEHVHRQARLLIHDNNPDDQETNVENKDGKDNNDNDLEDQDKDDQRN